MAEPLIENSNAADKPGAREVLVRVDGVGKRFCRSLKKSLWYGMQDILSDLRGRSGEHELRADEFWAVNDLSFKLSRGQCLGLIGHNGAGKTTLLKMLTGLNKPDAGRIEMRGKIGGLIALGAGFNPILSGRENIYVNASILGLTKAQTDAKIEEIVDFAELHEFIDTPVQNYSSGMNVRLGFAVAVILIEPDVLLLDEVLAVGDIGFTIKCLNAVRRLTNNSAVVFVSHNMQFVSSFCTRVMVMDHGRCVLDTPEPARGIDRYFEMVALESQVAGTGGAKIANVALKIGGQLQRGAEPQIPHGVEAAVYIETEVAPEHAAASLDVFIMDESMAPIVHVPILREDGTPFLLATGRSRLEIPLGVVELCAGKYSFVVAIADSATSLSLIRVQGLCPFRVFAESSDWGKIVRPAIISAPTSQEIQ